MPYGLWTMVSHFSCQAFIQRSHCSLLIDSDYTIFVWRRKHHGQENHATHPKSQLLESPEPSTSRSLLPDSPPSVVSSRNSMLGTPTLHLHNPKEPMPTPPAYLNASYYKFHPSQAHVPSTKRSPAPSNASTQRSKKGKNSNDDSEDNGIPKFKKDFERFHSENGVRTVMGSIGPVQNGSLKFHNILITSRSLTFTHSSNAP